MRGGREMRGLHLEITGDGADLVLLHGWGLNLRVWDGVVRELSDQFRVIALDLPGHGRNSGSAGPATPAEQAWLVHQTLEAVSDRYALVGWSLGGQIALDLAAATPTQVASLVLVATTPKFTSGPDWPHGIPVETLERLAAQLRTDPRRTLDSFLDLQTRGSSHRQRVREQLGNALAAQGSAHAGALALGLDRLMRSDLRPALAHVRAPVLVVAGQYDHITPPAASRALARGLPQARYVEFRRASHAPFLSHQRAFAALVARFVRSSARSTRPRTAAAKIRAGRRRRSPAS